MAFNRKKRYYKKKYDKGVIFTLLFILISLLVFIYSLIASNNKVIHNIQEVGTSRIESFATRIENVVDLYNLLMEMGAYQYELLYHKNSSQKDYDQWFKMFVSRASKTFDIQIDQVYIIDFSNNKFKLINSYNQDLNRFSKDFILSRPWFKSAVNNPGQIVFSPVYMDAHDNTSTVTIVTTVLNNQGLMALDINVEDMKEYWIPAKNGLDNSAYILLNSNGQYVFCNNMLEDSLKTHNIDKHRDTLIPFLYSKIKAINQPSGYFKTKINNLGEYYVFFSTDKKSGFIALTLLNSHEFYSKSPIWHVRYLIVLLVLAVASIIIYAEEQHLHKKNAESNEVVNMLGNSYYAIYRININTEEYSVVRSSPYIRKLIKESGLYSELYNTIIYYMDKSSKEEFEKSFTMERIKKMAEQDKIDYGIYLYRQLEDIYRWINLRIIIDKSISLDTVLLCFRECEEERKRELEHIGVLQDALETLRASSESKRILYSSVSHDMRTPLNGIIGIAELMGNFLHDPVKLADYLDKIKTSGAQLINLIDNFLETAKQESKILEINIETFSLQEKVEEIVNIFSIISQRDNKLFTYTSNIIHNTVKGDLNKLMHILNNILSNAFKYTKDNALIHFTIDEQETAGSSYYKFVVEDNGIGISEEFLDQVFTPFSREKREYTMQITGTGLGLAIVRSHVENMNGEIFIDSKYNEGTKVTIILPFEVAENIEKKERVSEIRNKVDISGSNVLVVEDNAVNMQIITELLLLKNIQVIQAWNGEEAVEIFKKSKLYSIDVVLMDIQMPVMDGLDAARYIRKLERDDAKTVPIISLSANIFEEDIRAAKEAGMDYYLAKPVNLDVLYDTLSKYIKK